MSSVVFSAMRNEAPYVLDWIAYHRAIGFDKICIVTNDCDDGTNALLGKLSAAGVIDFFVQTVPDGLSPQRAAVEMLERVGYLITGDWAVFLDADEYLNIHIGAGRIQDLTRHLEAEGLTGMLINWRVFGDGGQAQFTGSYISEDYLSCEAPATDTQFKTLFRKGRVASGFTGWLHRCKLVPGAAAPGDFITGSGLTLGQGSPGKAAQRHTQWLREGEEPFSHVLGDEIGYDIAQINHYMVRDPYSFALKKARGRGHATARQKKQRHTDDFYAAHNRNEAEDRSILRWQDDVAALKTVLIKDHGLEREVAQIAEIYHSHGDQTADAAKMTTDDAPAFALTFPEDVAAFVREVYAQAGAIIEYGSGGSTVLAAELGRPCVAVESDPDWAATLTKTLQNAHGASLTAQVLHIDMGPTKEWGFPRDNRKAQNFWQYPLRVWDDADLDKVDTVLIDGRMRKACFAATMLSIKRETRVLFDDYGERRRYHDVERFAKPQRMVGRMAEFVLRPGLVSTDDMRRVIPWFAQLA